MSENPQRVRQFDEGMMSDSVAENWGMVRIECTQSFNKVVNSYWTESYAFIEAIEEKLNDILKEEKAKKNQQAYKLK